MQNSDIGRAFEVPTNVVSKWFHDPGMDSEVPEISLTEPIQKWEKLAIFRRRMGWSIRYTAIQYGISHATLIKIEYGRGQRNLKKYVN